MKKVKVVKRFRDKFDHVTRYEVGTEHEFETERADDLIERGLAEAVEGTTLDPKDGKKSDSKKTTKETGKTEGPEKVEETEKTENSPE